MMNNVGRRSLSIAIFVVIFSTAAPAFAANPTTVTGEIVETYCWVVHGVGGAGHAQCGIECANKGLPVALYDTRSHAAVILLPERDKTSLPRELVAAMGQRVTVQGELVTRGGISFLIVQSWKRAGPTK